MVNYEIDPGILTPYLPYGTTLDFFGGKTYVSLVGFLFRNTSIFGCPVPFAGTFQEVNLRFYVVHDTGQEQRRGVVFVKETVPYKLVANIANRIYSEHYSVAAMRHQFILDSDELKIAYHWKPSATWYSMEANVGVKAFPIRQGSRDAFIFEHYYGYTSINRNLSEEYFIEHPVWQLHPIKKLEVTCDFGRMYGDDFAFLNEKSPDFAGLADGSGIKVKWNRRRFHAGSSG